MKRRYLRELYSDRVSQIKSRMPDCCIGVDVIVGFPGETEEEFKETYDFINSLDISYLHVFTYSERDNTEAGAMKNQVPVSERKRRNKMLRILSAKKLRAFYDQQKGKELSVIFEYENKNGFMYGFTQNYVKVKHPYDLSYCNNPTKISIGDFDEEGTMSCEILANRAIEEPEIMNLRA